MGSSNDGSLAAQGAQRSSDDDHPPEPGQRGIIGRILSAFSPNEPANDAGSSQSTALTLAHSLTLPGIANLRRLRVDDVAIPKVEVIAVPLDIGKDELVEV
ncbi:MAG: magnesium/cobalt efflux protein, partial [Cereibacter changlensis]